MPMANTRAIVLVLVPHERPHGIVRILDHCSTLLPKALEMCTFKDTMALIAHSTNVVCAAGRVVCAAGRD